MKKLLLGLSSISVLASTSSLAIACSIDDLLQQGEELTLTELMNLKVAKLFRGKMIKSSITINLPSENNSGGIGNSEVAILPISEFLGEITVKELIFNNSKEMVDALFKFKTYSFSEGTTIHTYSFISTIYLGSIAIREEILNLERNYDEETNELISVSYTFEDGHLETFDR